jgi:S1-C subfamily serine protease
MKLDATFTFHAKCALRIALGAAAAVFVAALLIRIDALERTVVDQRGKNADARREKASLERRLDAMEEASADDRAVFAAQLLALRGDLSAAGERTAESGSRSPFPFETVAAGIVELVCIDNADPAVYYTGSGTVIEKGGLILTNYHLLMSEDGSIIRFCGIGFTDDLQDPPLIEYLGAAVAGDEGLDLAVLQITEHLEDRALPEEFPWVEVAESRAAALDLNLGDPIFIGGYPGIGADTLTFTQGVVAGRVGKALIKTSALIDSGTSGGAAFDARGRYVGVPTAAAAGDIGGSLGYLISADAVDLFLTDYYAGELRLPRRDER